MSQLEMALGIFADNTGMSCTEWAALRQILTLVDHPMIQRLPHSLTTLKRHLSRELPLLPMCKKSIPLATEKIATEKALRKNGRIPRFQNDRRKPNVHAGLHHEQMTEEFGPLGHVGSLIGEDMHRKLKKEVYTTSHSNVEPALLMKENQQLTLRLVNNAFDTDISCRTIIHIGDFIEYKDFATRANRIGKVDGIFVHQLPETQRLFCRISEAEFTGNGGVSARDPVLDLLILRLTGGKSLVGLPRIGSRNLYVIDVDDTLVLVNWIDVHSL
ncbi:hypothetical protein V8E54_011165 [Elaphomyces granulatus]